MEIINSFANYLQDQGAGAFLVSTLVVTLAEIGDKTQLLALLLIARYRQPWPIIAGIFVATLANHAGAAWLGSFAAQWLASNWLAWILGISFILMGLWILVPDKLDNEDTNQKVFQKGAFLATCILFFLAEMGDKTQVATVFLGANFNSLFAVIMGTTLGMLLANVPVILLGQFSLQRIPVRTINLVTAVLFILLGILTLVAG